MKIVIRVDASLEMGTGHVMRCLTLAEALKNKGEEVQFICRNHKGNLIKKIENSGFNVFSLEVSNNHNCEDKLSHSNWLGVTQKQDSDECASILKNSHSDWIIIDHYGIDEDWQVALGGYCNKIMVIDDLADRKHSCDVLLDQTFGRQKHDYKSLVPKSCRLLLGSKYALLRSEFLRWRQYSLERRNQIDFKKLVINMGGTDPDNATEKVLQELVECSLPEDIEITIIMGQNSSHLESVKTKANALFYNTEVKTNVNNMAEIMANSDLAIGASGATSWERCCLGLPSIQIAIADNQKNIAKNLEVKNIIKLLKSIDQLCPSIEIVVKKLADYSYNAKCIIDGKGTKRVISMLYE